MNINKVPSFLSGCPVRSLWFFSNVTLCFNFWLGFFRNHRQSFYHVHGRLQNRHAKTQSGTSLQSLFAALCDSEYGVGGYYVGVPVVMGSNGVEKVIELSLTEKETADFQNSVDAVKQLVATMDDLLSA